LSKKLHEAIRKSIHLGSLVIPFGYRYLLAYNRLLMFLCLVVVLVVFLGVEMIRIEQSTIRKAFHRVFGNLLRQHERNDFTGATFVVLSSMLCVVFLNPLIAFLAISYLSIGDTFAAMVGMAVGKRKFVNQSKSLEGSLACFVSILIFSIFFSGDLSPWVYVIGCLSATLAELWVLPVDDNIKIPITSGIVMSLIHIIV
jgi:dolichol kinase